MIASDGLPARTTSTSASARRRPGCRCEYLREEYPDATIVLQHQYWDLTVGEESFEVTVSFNKRNERLKVPFAAMVAFVDPSVRFGLQFEKRDQPASQLPAPETLPALAGPPDADAASPDGSAAAPDKDSLHVTAEDMKDGKPAKDADAKVVALDAFRKK